MAEKLHQVDQPLRDQLKKHAVLLLVLAVFFALVMRAWPTTWDDSGITLAFSKNLARFGDIFPTPLNSRLEGYSSFLWMALNTFFFKLGLGESIVVLFAKIISTGCILVNILLFWKLLAANIHTPLYRATALVLYAINNYTVAAAVDGMETALYALIVLLAYFLYKKHQASRSWYVVFALVGALLILMRHEGALFLAPFAIEVLLRRRQNVFKEPFLYFWAFIFLAYHGWHYAFFGEVLTNPMLAKRYWPYRPDFQGWESVATFYLTPVFDFFFRYITLFISLPIYFLLRRKFKPNDSTQENWTLIGFISLIAVFVILITGQNWGAAARLSYPGLAFLLLLLFSKMDDQELLRRSKVLQVGVTLALLINAVIIFEGARQLIPDLITLEGVERRASVLVATKNALGLSTITIASPDMGGLLLYHADGVKVVDLGLLCDKELAHNGYLHYDKYVFKQSNPEIISANGFWLTPLRKAPDFTRSYYPMLVMTEREQVIMYIRRDMIAKLEQQYAMPSMDPKSAPIIDDKIGYETVAEFGGYRILDLTENAKTLGKTNP